MDESEREHRVQLENEKPWEDVTADAEDDGPPAAPRQPVAVQSPGLLGALPSAANVLRYIPDKLGPVFRVLKIPISLIIATISCIYIISLVSGVIRTALAPICSVPIISPACPAFVFTKPNGPQEPDFPGLLTIECTNLESLLEETVKGPRLALKMKQVEMETRDLVALVRTSDLSSREVLADSLRMFVEDARKVSRGLTRFSSRVGVAVDNIIDSALSAIESDAKSSAFSTSRSLQPLVHEAKASIFDLHKLEGHLNSIHDVVSREDSPFSAAKELLAQLWTKMGGDRKEFRGMYERRALFKRVGKYRDRARGMEELRDRMVAPSLLMKRCR
ncbi:hypothetical protein EI94DRAFT_1740560 [Lactarius quietus]|nr:hypothetical protein EI94DRAFT_1740560 [Lactarius quietus]